MTPSVVLRPVAATAALVVLAGCGGGSGAALEEEPGGVPAAVAEAVPFDGTGLTPTPGPTPDPDPGPSATSDASPDPGPTATPSTVPAVEAGPTSGDAAAFVASEVLRDLGGLQHVVVDLDGDTWAEVVATGVVERAGVVRVAWWTADGYEVLAEDAGGAGRDVTDLRAADLNRDGTTELLVRVEGDGRRSLALWAVPGRGELVRLEAEGGCSDGSHVYGVTRARLEVAGDGPPVVVADCDDSPLPVADWSERRWRWSDGAYRLVEAGEVERAPGRGQDDRADRDDVDAEVADGSEPDDD